MTDKPKKPENKDDGGPFPERIFPKEIFPRSIFPWMGGNDDEDENDEREEK